MLRKFLEQRAEKRRLFRSLLSDTLVRKLSESGELIVDRRLLSELGATRRELFRAAYSLAMKEKLHVLADQDGLVRLYTNDRFDAMTRAVALGEKAAAFMAELSVTDPDSAALVLEETVVVDPIPAEQTPAPAKEPTRRFDSAKTPAALSKTAAPAHYQDGWQDDAQELPEIEDWPDFVVSSGIEGRGNLPDTRQTLPPRERDPWPAFDAVDLPPFDVTKKK